MIVLLFPPLILAFSLHLHLFFPLFYLLLPLPLLLPLLFLPGNEYKCSAAGEMVGVSGDCSAFVMCTSASGGVRMGCTPGLKFNLKTKNCDWPSNVHRNDCN